MVDDGKKNGLLPMVTEIVAAHLSNNTVTMTDIPRLINEVYAALSDLGQAQSKPAERQEPAIPLKKSITADYIVCLEDGKKLKMLKRHLRTAYGLTPEQYREKWGLPRGLSHGGAELREEAQHPRPANRPGHRRPAPLSSTRHRKNPFGIGAKHRPGVRVCAPARLPGTT